MDAVQAYFTVMFYRNMKGQITFLKINIMHLQIVTIFF